MNKAWLKNKASKVRYWLPPILYRALVNMAVAAMFSTSPHKALLSPNDALRNRGKGRRAFLLATGPSIRRENLKLLAGEDCFSLSSFFLHDAIGVIQPKYHFFAPYHEPMVLENYVAWLRAADARLPAETAIFLGSSGRDLVDRYALFPRRTVNYLYLAPFENKVSLDISGPILSPQTGPLMMLPVLLYMGYSTIYLLGCDHTAVRDFGGNISYFYDQGKEVRTTSGGPTAWADITTELECTARVFRQYRLYQDLIDTRCPDTKIVNLSADSWIDCFPFDSLENVLH